MERSDILRRIPSVDRVLQEAEIGDALDRDGLPRPVVVEAVRRTLDRVRRALLEGRQVDLDPRRVAAESLDAARREVSPRLQRVVNATGVVLHTNLGRAPLSCEAIAAVERVAGYCNLEYRLEEGRRGHRHDAVEGVLREVTGAEAALVVNNNAAAVLLGLTALARGREVVVSRGELVEIGGAFRVPDVMAQSGALLREVGTTNKTRVEDYERAIGPETGLLLKVHTSNYRVLGFTASVDVAELVTLGRRCGVPVMEDLGSGSLVDLARIGLEHEPTVQEAVASGADLVTFSGDKLLGGPQAGILVGCREAVAACGRHPLMRALRPDKLTLAGLEATLALYRDPERAPYRVPALSMLAEPLESLRGRAEILARDLQEVVGAGVRVSTAEDVSQAGGGSLPLQELPTQVVEIRRDRGGLSSLEARLREHRPPVVARIREDALVFDLRTLRPGEDRIVVEAVRWALEGEEKR